MMPKKKKKVRGMSADPENVRDMGAEVESSTSSQLGTCALSASNMLLPHMCLRKNMIALCKHRSDNKELGSIQMSLSFSLLLGLPKCLC